MMPSTGTLVLPNRSIARVASISDRSCGVETITAPAGRDFWTSDSCTSPVPGGRSTRMISVSPQSPSISWFSAPDAIGPRHASAWPGRHQLADRQQLDALGLDRDQLVILGVRLFGRSEQGRLRRAVNVGVDDADPLAHSRQRDGEVGGQRRLADAALARADGDEGSARLGRGQRDPRLADAGQRQRRRLQPRLQRRRARRRSGRDASATIVAMSPTSLRDRIRSASGRSSRASSGSSVAHRQRP